MSGTPVHVVFVRGCSIMGVLGKMPGGCGLAKSAADLVKFHCSAGGVDAHAPAERTKISIEVFI